MVLFDHGRKGYSGLKLKRGIAKNEHRRFQTVSIGSREPTR